MGTILEGFSSQLNYDNQNTLVHISDIMRVVLLYKFGGFYLDFDTIVRTDLRKIKNSIGLEGQLFFLKKSPFQFPFLKN